MICYAVYFLTPEGKVLLSEYFQSIDAIPNEKILGGLLLSLQGIAIEITNNSFFMRTIEIENISYHIRFFGLFSIVIVTDEPKIPEQVIQTLGIRFMKKFSDYLIDKKIDNRVFEPFRDDLLEIMKVNVQTDESKSVFPTKPVTTFEIFKLPPNLRETFVTLIGLKEATSDEISREMNDSSLEITSNLNKLLTMGIIGKKYKENQEYYFYAH